MSNNNNATATAISNLLWEGSVEIVHNLASLIAKLCQELKEDKKKVGSLIGDEWYKVGADVNGSKPIRLLIEACMATNMERKDISALVNATEIVSKQRVSQLLAVIVDGDKSKNKGSKDKPSKEGTGQGGLDKSEIPSWDAILKAIKAQPSLTKAQAEEAAALLASKIA
jgi:hypothetical protein